MNRRPGVTLLEALVAIFIAGLGLMAVMTLFPLGALNMAQALRDDRAAHCAANATDILRSVWRVSLENGQTDPQLEAALARGPVYLDPIGVYNGFGGTIGAIPRLSLASITRSQDAYRWFSLLDDINFTRSGLPVGAPNSVQRESRFSWAYMIRRLDLRDPRVLEFSVVVYHNRPMTLQPGLGTPGETAHSASFTGLNNVTIAGSPKLRRGGWIMDGEGYFYRAASVVNRGGSLEVELQTPLRGSGGSQVVVMETVAEVFEKSTLE